MEQEKVKKEEIPDRLKRIESEDELSRKEGDDRIAKTPTKTERVGNVERSPESS